MNPTLDSYRNESGFKIVNPTNLLSALATQMGCMIMIPMLS